MVVCFFFVKQKTEYELRISEWSSDVCSSDLEGFAASRCSLGKTGHFAQGHRWRLFQQQRIARLQTGQGNAMTGCGGRTDGYCVHDLCRKHIGVILEKWRLCIVAGLGVADCGQLEIRSEEHTSELQSLMRISYAVFCLKNKN